METVKTSFLTYTSHFQIADYFAFAWLVLLFFIILFVAILLAKKRPALAFAVLILDLILLVVGPIGIKFVLDSYLRKNSVELQTVHQLVYSDTLIIQGKIYNKGRINFQKCFLHVKILPKPKDGFLSTIKNIKPLHRKSIYIKEPPAIGKSSEFELMWEGVRLQEDQNLSVKGECY